MAKSGCVRSVYSCISMYRFFCKCQLDGDLERCMILYQNIAMEKEVKG